MIFKNNSLDLAANYDYFILDVWGVIHDGTATYPMVIENLKSLRDMGKKICFLSNAPRRASKVADILKKFGITADFYDFIMTSGEASYLFLEENQKQQFQQFGQNYYYIGPKKDEDILDGLQYKRVMDAGEADFVLTTGFDNDLSVIEEKIPDLKNAIKHNLPLICINPDLIVVKQTGHEMFCAGVIAQQYKEMGGEVVYFGKPYKPVYEQVIKSFALDNTNKILAIGDGIETDILGANNNNIDNALIGGGILSNKLNIKHGELPDKNKLEEICQEYGIRPKFVIAGL